MPALLNIIHLCFYNLIMKKAACRHGAKDNYQIVSRFI
jgi:hypothetical protein